MEIKYILKHGIDFDKIGFVLLDSKNISLIWQAKIVSENWGMTFDNTNNIEKMELPVVGRNAETKMVDALEGKNNKYFDFFNPFYLFTELFF